MNRQQVASDFLPVDDLFLQAADLGHPQSQNPVGEAARAVLVFRPLSVDDLDHRLIGWALDFRFLRHEIVMKPLFLNDLNEVLAVVEFFFHPTGSLFEKLPIKRGVVADLFSHFDHGSQGAEIEGPAMAVGTEIVDVVSVVVFFFEQPGVAGIVFVDHVMHAGLDFRPEADQPMMIAGDSPFSIGFHDASELSVGRIERAPAVGRGKVHPKRLPSGLRLPFEIFVAPE